MTGLLECVGGIERGEGKRDRTLVYDALGVVDCQSKVLQTSTAFSSIRGISFLR